jgi:hypothetical protein
MYAAALVLMAVGIGMMLLGWLFFRRPGVAFRSLAPIWQANRFLRPPGVALWIGGSAISLVGMVLLMVAARP